MNNRRSSDRDLAELRSRLEEHEKRLAMVEHRLEGHTDEQIIGIFYREVGQGTARLIGRSLLYLVGALITALVVGALTYCGFKTHT